MPVRGGRAGAGRRAAALTGAALVALSVIPLRLPASEYPPLAPFVVPFLWLTTAPAVALGLYLRTQLRTVTDQFAAHGPAATLTLNPRLATGALRPLWASSQITGRSYPEMCEVGTWTPGV
ncbi:hypothetical protein [Streptomyces aquilus]|uniref:hypothetical protein n=1 Tax=Streptomyces aquilus TaxID=2548456 RepID=UPI0036CB6869